MNISEEFEVWWAERYEQSFSSMSGIMVQAWKEVARAAYMAAWAKYS